jgi:hypothetical protein
MPSGESVPVWAALKERMGIFMSFALVLFSWHSSTWGEKLLFTASPEITDSGQGRA